MALRRQLPSRIQTESLGGEAAPAPKVPVTQSVPPIPQTSASQPETPPAPVTDLAALGAMMADLPAAQPQPVTEPEAQPTPQPEPKPEPQPVAASWVPSGLPETQAVAEIPVTPTVEPAPATPPVDTPAEPPAAPPAGPDAAATTAPTPTETVAETPAEAVVDTPAVDASATVIPAAAVSGPQVSEPLPEPAAATVKDTPGTAGTVPATNTDQAVIIPAVNTPSAVAAPTAEAPEAASTPETSAPSAENPPPEPSLPDDDNPMRRRPKQPRTFTFTGPQTESQPQKIEPVAVPKALADTTPVDQIDTRLRQAGLLPTPVADELTAGLPPAPEGDAPQLADQAALPPAFVPPPAIPATVAASVPPTLPPALSVGDVPAVSFDFLPPTAAQPAAPVTSVPPATNSDNENMQMGSASDLLAELKPAVSAPAEALKPAPDASAVPPVSIAASAPETPAAPPGPMPWMADTAAAGAPAPASGGGWGMSWDTPVIAAAAAPENPMASGPAAVPPVPDVFGSQAAGTSVPPPPPAPEIMGQNGRGMPLVRGNGRPAARGGTWQVGVAAAVVAGALFGAYQLVSRDQSSPLALSGHASGGAIAIGEPSPTLLPPPTVSGALKDTAMSSDVFNANGQTLTPSSSAVIDFADVPPAEANQPVVADGTETMPNDIGLLARFQQAVAEEKAKKAAGTSDAITGSTSTSLAGVDVAAAGAATDPNDLKAKYAEELEAYRKALAASPKDTAPTPGEFLKSGGATAAAAAPGGPVLDSEGAPVSTPNGDLLPPPSVTGSSAVPPDELYRNNPKNLPVVPEPAGVQAAPVRQLTDFDVAMFAPEKDRVRIPQGIKPRFSSSDFPQMDVLSFVPGKGVIAYREGREGVLLVGESIDGWELVNVSGTNAEFRNGQRSQYVTAD